MALEESVETRHSMVDDLMNKFASIDIDQAIFARCFDRYDTLDTNMKMVHQWTVKDNIRNQDPFLFDQLRTISNLSLIHI